MAILQSVVQRFSAKPANPSGLEATGLSSFSALVDQLAPLFVLMEQRKLIDVISERSGERFQSMILGIDLAGGFMELDELFPCPALSAFSPGDDFSVQYHQAGEVLCFSVVLRDVCNSSGAPVYRVSLPRDIQIRQRRRNPRLALSRQRPLSVKLLSPHKMRWFATAVNVSCDGMRLLIGGNVLDQLSKDAILPACEFRFGEDCQVRCEALVKAFRFSRRPCRLTEMSIAFLALPRHQRQLLSQLVNCVQPSPWAA